MVIKNPPTTTPSRESTPSSASSTVTGSQTNTATGAAGTAPGAGPFGGIGAILNNPMVRDMMNSPLVEK